MRATAFWYPDSSQQQPWNGDYSYSFGYAGYTPGSFSVQYANYAGTRYPGHDSGSGKFREGTISLTVLADLGGAMSAQHVLIVEDSLVYRRLLSRMLTQWGYIVSEAENGVDALAILENQPVSTVISDWEMPEMNGLTLCREIRRRQFGRYVYLILLTAREDHGDLTQGFEAGADDFLSKPVEQSELRARLHAGARILSLEADLAARNARLSEALRQIEQDLELAARIQQSVLPAHQLRHQGFFSDWIFLPSARVSGIFLTSSRWAIVSDFTAWMSPDTAWGRR